jgi:tetratricopeptide (TPR) repeat protein
MNVGRSPFLIVCFLLCWILFPAFGQTTPSSVQELAKKLLDAPSSQAQQSLLAAHSSLINLTLAQALIAAGKNEKDRTQAMHIFALTAEVASQIKARVEAAQAFNSLGVAYSGVGNYDAALSAFEQSLQIRRTLPNPFEVAKTLNNIAAMHEYKGFYDRSLVANEESLKIKQQLLAQTPEDTDLQKSVATSLVNLGLTHKTLGNLPLASQYYEHSLQLFQALRDNASAVRTLNNLGVVAYEQGHYARARRITSRRSSETARPPNLTSNKKRKFSTTSV